MEDLKNDSFYLLRKSEEIHNILIEFLENKKVSFEKMKLLERKAFVLKTAIKSQIFFKK